MHQLTLLIGYRSIARRRSARACFDIRERPFRHFDFSTKSTSLFRALRRPRAEIPFVGDACKLPFAIRESNQRSRVHVVPSARDIIRVLGRIGGCLTPVATFSRDPHRQSGIRVCLSFSFRARWHREIIPTDIRGIAESLLRRV